MYSKEKSGKDGVFEICRRTCVLVALHMIELTVSLNNKQGRYS